MHSSRLWEEEAQQLAQPEHQEEHQEALHRAEQIFRQRFLLSLEEASLHLEVALQESFFRAEHLELWRRRLWYHLEALRVEA